MNDRLTPEQRAQVIVAAVGDQIMAWLRERRAEKARTTAAEGKEVREDSQPAAKVS